MSTPTSRSTVWSSPAESGPYNSLSIHPAASISELLGAYGVRHTAAKPFMAPPPALARFPPGYKAFERVHTRARPGSSLHFSRAPSRPSSTRTPFHPARNIYNARSKLRCSELLSDELRRSSSDSINFSEHYRRDSAISTIPKLKYRKPVVEMVSRTTQTSPVLSTLPLNGGREINIPGSGEGKVFLSRLDGAVEGPTFVNTSRSINYHIRRVKQSRNRSDAITPDPLITENFDNNLKCAGSGSGRRSQHGPLTLPNNVEVSGVGTTRSHTESRVKSKRYSEQTTSDSLPSTNVTDIKAIRQAMEEYYRSRGSNTIPLMVVRRSDPISGGHHERGSKNMSDAPISILSGKSKPQPAGQDSSRHYNTSPNIPCLQSSFGNADLLFPRAARASPFADAAPHSCGECPPPWEPPCSPDL